jgi:hypothetical protein
MIKFFYLGAAANFIILRLISFFDKSVTLTMFDGSNFFLFKVNEGHEIRISSAS